LIAQQLPHCKYRHRHYACNK